MNIEECYKILNSSKKDSLENIANKWDIFNLEKKEDKKQNDRDIIYAFYMICKEKNKEVPILMIKKLFSYFNTLHSNADRSVEEIVKIIDMIKHDDVSSKK